MSGGGRSGDERRAGVCSEMKEQNEEALVLLLERKKINPWFLLHLFMGNGSPWFIWRLVCLV